MFDEPMSDMLTDAVNCLGISGAGLALAFKKMFPEYQSAYAEAARNGDVNLGSVWLYETGFLSPPFWIVSFPTIYHYNDITDTASIAKGIQHYRTIIEEVKPGTVSIPALGCGLAGGDWNTISRIIIDGLNGLDCDVKLFKPR